MSKNNDAKRLELDPARYPVHSELQKNMGSIKRTLKLLKDLRRTSGTVLCKSDSYGCSTSRMNKSEELEAVLLVHGIKSGELLREREELMGLIDDALLGCPIPPGLE